MAKEINGIIQSHVPTAAFLMSLNYPIPTPIHSLRVQRDVSIIDIRPGFRKLPRADISMMPEFEMYYL